jgi:hypothetical protein
MTVDPYEQYADAFGEQLRGASARVGRRRAAGRWVVAVVAGVAALAGAVLGLPGGQSLSIVSQARAALGGDNEIVHFTTLVTEPGSQHSPNCQLNWPTEAWTATSGPPRWRTADQIPPHPCGVSMAHGRVVTGDQEFAYADGTESWYTATEGVLHRTTGFPVGSSASHLLLPTPGGQALGTDPVDWLRHLLASGVHDDGLTTLGGRSVRELSATVRTPFRLVRVKGGYTASTRGSTTDARQTRVTRSIYFFDPQTFAPVRFETQAHLQPSVPGSGQHLLTVMAQTDIRVDFSNYQRIPLTPTTERLLAIHPPAGTAVRTQSLKRIQARRARYRREHR